MRKWFLIIVNAIIVLQAAAQGSSYFPSAGTEFYFTIFDHWKWTAQDKNTEDCVISVSAINETDVTITFGTHQYEYHLAANATQSLHLSDNAIKSILPLQCVHVTSTTPCFVNVWIKGGTGSSASMILPAHMLGRHYMLQGVYGVIVDNKPAYPMLSIIGTQEGTTVTVKPTVPLYCLSTAEEVSSERSFVIDQETVLYFRTSDYSQAYTGTVIEADQPIAVFQGNEVAQIPLGTDWKDQMWEQARPTTNWGTEFIITKSTLLDYNIASILALEDNTEVYCWNQGNKELQTTLSAGQTYGITLRDQSIQLIAKHIETSKPACCYLYLTGCNANGSVGDPEMTEIAPVDNMATEARWYLEHNDHNSPYRSKLIVTTNLSDDGHVLYNNRQLSSINGMKRLEIDSYVTYDIPISSRGAGVLKTDQGGFSAYVIHTGQVAEGSAFNVSLPYKVPELCPDGQLVYSKTSCGFWSIYTETVGGFCPGSKLSFSALVSYSRYEPIKVFIMDPTTNKEVASYERAFYEEGAETIYYNGRKWHRIGVDYIVPEGVSDLKFGISNGYNALIDSFEVRLCTPPLTIIAPDTVCVDTKNIFIAEFENDGSFAEPLQYQWYFSADSITWTPLDEGHQKQLKIKAKPRHTGWYKVAVAGSGNINNEMCRAMSEPHKFFVIEDCPPILCPDGILLFREDFGGNDPNDSRVSQTPVPSMTYNQLMTDEWPSMRAGSYIITKSGYCNGDTTSSNQPQNRRSQWHLQDDHTYPNDKTRGYFMEVDGKGDNAAFYSLIIENLCSGSDLSFVAYVANVMTWVQYENTPGRYAYPRLLFRLTDPTTNAELGVYDTGEIPFDSTFLNDYSCWQQSSEWHQVGMNFTVPEGLGSVKLTIYNNSQGTTGNDFAIDDIEVRLCMEPISISSANPACRKKSHTFYGAYENWGTLESPEFMWTYSADSLTWTELQRGANRNYTIPTVHRSHEGWYKVMVANAGNLDMVNCRSESEPFKLETMYCNTAVDQYIDTTACDTLLEYDLHWRGHPWPEVGTVIDTLRDIDIDDSLYIHLTLDTKICCPDIQTFRIDSAICDTLLPFMWFYKDTVLLFDEPAAKDIDYRHPRWENCIGERVTLALDTFHCERLYPITVNKYNWQLLLDYISLRRFFPERQYLAFQWYKNGEPIVGAIDDDYAEQNELNGFFQLCIKLDEPVDNHDEYIWSNILEIGETPAPAPVTKRIYNSSGLLISEERLTRGVYLILYQQGDKFWTEKKVIP